MNFFSLSVASPFTRKAPGFYLLLSVFILSPSFVLADAVKGLEIAKERKARDIGWQDSTASMEMILKNASGDTANRLMRMKSLEVANDGDKGLTVFDEPRDVKGTAFLSHSHTQGADDQWLYLPALKRVKRISSRNKSGPFMGSEFAYEDLTSFELEKYDFNYVRDEAIDGVSLFVVEQKPHDKKSGYKRQVVWLDKDEYRPHKVEFYDRKNALLKTLTFQNYELYLDKYWRAHTLEMINHQTGKSTTLKTMNIKFQTGLEENDFNKNILKRIK
ncbi:outer membrane lipoprotein-sorting protein [Vibrio hannami]|uniref:outer membrane lipoprotein-sorting protein n=1 Tax=Vibrio hannami TaxID=2717094 RepID=UPI00240F212C|nr:outer membrane lipoprotein-sorting protein [Vibrio hannami]MDG3088304.1 outer membrane lipoprotein-sorting protein [Vibrio hannami]